MKIKIERNHEADDEDNPVGIYLLKVKSRRTRTRCEICSKLTIKTPERRYWHRSGVFMSLLLTLNIFHT